MRAALVVFPIVQKRSIISPSKRRSLRARSCCSQLLPNSRRRPVCRRSCCTQLLPNSKRRPLRGHSCCYDPNSPKESHYFACKKKDRFAPVVVVPNCCPIQIGSLFAPIVVVPNCYPIPEGGRFAALVVVPIVQKRPIISPSKKRRPLRAPVVVVPNCCQAPSSLGNWRQ